MTKKLTKTRCDLLLGTQIQRLEYVTLHKIDDHSLAKATFNELLDLKH